MAVITLEVSGKTPLILEDISLTYDSKPNSRNNTVQKGFTGSGDFLVYSGRDTKTEIILSMRRISKADFRKILNFIKNDAEYQLNEISVTVDSLDLGKGTGVMVSRCKFLSNTTQGLYDYKMPESFDFTLPLITKEV